MIFPFAVVGIFSFCLVGLRNEPVTATKLQVGAMSLTMAGDYSKFEHNSPKAHADLMANCASCHRRRDSSVEPAFPLHKDCTGCHIVQFTGANNSAFNPICTICHNADGLSSPNPPLKKYSRLVGFTAQFDHAQHLSGRAEARPPNGCIACHSPSQRGIAESIPAHLNAHKICYDCHSPGKSAAQTSSCGSCHKPGNYSPTPASSRAYQMAFSHADHSARARLTCERCHDVRKGLPQRRQVTSIATIEHLPNARACVTCHNGQRTFGEQLNGNFDNCRRCHKGVKFGA